MFIDYKGRFAGIKKKDFEYYVRIVQNNKTSKIISINDCGWRFALDPIEDHIKLKKTWLEEVELNKKVK